MRLSKSTLSGVPAAIERPGYDRAAARRGVVHLGIGAFHRAHQAVYFDRALAGGDLRWAITGVSLRSGNVRDQMQPQDGLYGVVVRDGDEERTRIIGAVREVLVATEDPAAVIAAMADADTHIVTLTITEKGYKLDRAGGGLLSDDPDVAADLASLDAPRTAIGFIVAALAERFARNQPPFTAMSCDNLPHNGALLRAAVIAMARAHNADLADWIARAGAFPASMVDRIVPATTEADIAAHTARLGVEDRAMVKTEPFTQWVIEDSFAGERPDFAALGVQLTDAVGPWEDAKLRLLNGAHSAIAYLGGLAGDTFVHDFVGRAEGRAFVEKLWDEAEPTLSPPDELDVAQYRRDLMARFSNPALQHRTHQIAMDGSQKLPQRLIATLADRRAANQPIDALALAVAAWMRWQSGRTDAGERFTVEDPIADRLAAADGVEAMLTAIGATLDADARSAIAGWLDALERDGAAAAVRAIVS